MARIIRTLKWIRNNWKKSTFFAGVISYGVSYANEKYEINQLMRAYCEQAQEYSEQKIDVHAPLKQVLVILNPAANKKDAEEDFYKYCAPILNLAGFQVNLVKTTEEGFAIRYIEQLEKLPDVVVVAGGDGSLAETVTGLLRRFPDTGSVKVGVLPVGFQNSFSYRLYSKEEQPTDKVEKVRSMANAALSVVRDKSELKDVLKIELLKDEENSEKKPFYALSTFQWGAYRDIFAKRDQYWYTNGLRTYAAFLFNGFHREKVGVTWDCSASLTYTDPCQGCTNCYEKHETNLQKLQKTRWWSSFIPKFGSAAKKAEGPDYSKIVNENCSVTKDLEVNCNEIILTTNNIENPNEKQSKLHIKIGAPYDSGFSFIGDSWKRVWTRNFYNKPEYQLIEARSVELRPKQSEENAEERYFNIDNENYEVMPIKISLIPRRIKFFTME